MAERKNPDYSASAVNLVNPPEIGEQIMRLQDAQARCNSLKANLEAYPEYNLMQEQEKAIANITAQIRGMIDAQGSYQDIESGFYALKYKRISKSYDAVRFKDAYAKFAPAVIVEQVNVKALEGLIKGGLLTEQDLDTHQVIVRSESYAYIIK